MARPTDDPKSFRMELRIQPHLVEQVDEWRRHQSDIPPRAEAIRRLIIRGLNYGALSSVATNLFIALAEMQKAGHPLTEEQEKWLRDAAGMLPLLEGFMEAHDNQPEGPSADG